MYKAHTPLTFCYCSVKQVKQSLSYTPLLSQIDHVTRLATKLATSFGGVFADHNVGSTLEVQKRKFSEISKFHPNHQFSFLVRYI